MRRFALCCCAVERELVAGGTAIMCPATVGALLLVGVSAVLACGGAENLTEPATGTLEVASSTTGVDLDRDGYTVQIDTEPAQEIGLTGTIQHTGLAPGTHTVELGGVAANCAVSGDNPRALSIARGETATVGFEIACSPTTGSLSITSATIGSALDPDGYTVTLDGIDRGTLGGNAQVTLDELTPGEHSLGLSGLLPICQLESDNPQPVTISAGAIATAAFDVACLASPEVPPGGPGLPPPLPRSTGEAFFVAPAGSDTNPGTIRAPWRTIQRAMDGLNPNEVAYVRAGTYETGGAFGTSADTYVWTSKCSASAPCSILAFPGERPVLHGQILVGGEGLRLSGFIIEGPLSADVASCSGRRANQIDVAGASYIELSHNEIRHNDYHAGINMTSGEHIQILSNWIHHNGRFSLTTDPCTGNEVYETDHGIYWEATEGAGGNLVANNLIHHNRAKGVQFYDGQIAHPVVVSHNTIVENGNTGILVNGSADRITIVNNVVAFNGATVPQKQIRIQQGNDHVIRSNLTHALESSLAGIENTTQSVMEDNLEAEPGFVNRAGSDFRLLAGSPAEGRAVAEYAAGADIEGTIRPQGAGGDLGAYEIGTRTAVKRPRSR